MSSQDIIARIQTVIKNYRAGDSNAQAELENVVQVLGDYVGGNQTVLGDKVSGDKVIVEAINQINNQNSLDDEQLASLVRHLEKVVVGILKENPTNRRGILNNSWTVTIIGGLIVAVLSGVIVLVFQQKIFPSEQPNVMINIDGEQLLKAGDNTPNDGNSPQPQNDLEKANANDTEYQEPPTATPLPILTPTRIPTPTPDCPIVDGTFSSVWASAKESIGCASGNPIEGLIVEENFEYGKMFWRDSIDTAQALVVFNNGTWKIFYHTPYVESSSEYTCPDANTPEQTPPTPRRGFGMMWCNIPEIRIGLGNAIDDERGYRGYMQSFENGFMIRTDYGATFIFLNNGSWQQWK